MLKRIAIRKDWTISMSEFRKFAEKYQWEIDKLREDNKKLKEDVDYFRQCYLDLKKLCEKEWFMLSAEEVTKILLDKKSKENKSDKKT